MKNCPRYFKNKFMTFEEWFNEFEEEIETDISERGRDKEMCFDSERETEEMYAKYLSLYEILNKSDDTN